MLSNRKTISYIFKFLCFFALFTSHLKQFELYATSIESANSYRKSFTLEEFQALHISGKFEIEVNIEKKQSLTIEAERDYLDSLNIQVKNKVLYVVPNSTQKNFWPWKKDKAIIKISVNKLSAVELMGSSQFFLHNIAAHHFKISASGATKLDLAGNVEFLKVDVSGATEVKAFKLKAKHIDIRAMDACDVEVFAKKSVKVSASGASNVTYKGNAIIAKQRISGISSLKKKNS
ncbi:MAG: head GIN domain-containing protein [Bdellovibrionota bacterium]